MDTLTRHKAQQRADEIRIFQDELERLEREQVLQLSTEQQQAVTAYHHDLLARYAQDFDIDHDVRTSQLSLGMRIASLFGALALSASVFFLFYRYWGWLATGLQVTILLAAPLAMLGVTALIRRKDTSGYFAKLAAMVTFACFVLDITMLGQIFNITPSDNALVPWAALAFLLAYSCDLRLLQAAGILCLVAFIAARTGTWNGLYWLDFGERPENFFPAAILLFALPQLVRHDRFGDFPAIYRIFGLLTLFLPMLVLANWGMISYLDVDRDLVEGGYQVAGFVFSAAAVWYGVRRHWPEVMNTGITFFLIFLYTKFFDWWWEIMPKYLFFLVLGLTAVLFLLVLRRWRATGYRLSGEPAS